MNEFNVLLGAATNGTPSGSLFDALFARYIAPQESWRELESPLPITILSAGEDMINYRIYGNTENGESVGERTESGEPTGYKLPMAVRSENLFEVESDMLSYLNWVLNPPHAGISYFMNYKLSDEVTQELKKGTHTCSIFEHFTDGYTPKLLVCAFTPTVTSAVGQEYRILTNQGVTLTKTFDFSSWDNIYLIIGYGEGIYSDSLKQQKIDELFTNWRISIVKGSTAPTEYIPYYRDEENIYIGSDPLAEDEYVDFGGQKVYRMEGGTLTPTDPPVPIPALPTTEGETIIDYNPSETPAVEPEKMYIKYKPQ